MPTYSATKQRKGTPQAPVLSLKYTDLRQCLSPSLAGAALQSLQLRQAGSHDMAK